MQLRKPQTAISTGKTALIYANPGIGKTYSLQYLLGKTLILDVDKGTSVLKDSVRQDIDILDIDSDLANLTEAIAFLEEGKHDYKNVCLDTLSELEKTMLTILGRTGKNNSAPELLHYNQVNFKLTDLCRRLRNLTSSGVNVIFTAWLKLGEIIAPTGEKYSVQKPLLSDKIIENICGLCDIVSRLEISPKDNETRFFRLSDVSGYCRDRLFKRKFAEVDNIFNTKEIKKDEPKKS